VEIIGPENGNYAAAGRRKSNSLFTEYRKTGKICPSAEIGSSSDSAPPFLGP
jgi:hypothetical protein